MSTRDIQEQIKALYDIEISSELVSKISEKIMPQVNEWHNRPLEEHYPFIFMDAKHYKIRDTHAIVTKAAYVVLGINSEGYKVFRISSSCTIKVLTQHQRRRRFATNIYNPHHISRNGFAPPPALFLEKTIESVYDMMQSYQRNCMILSHVRRLS